MSPNLFSDVLLRRVFRRIAYFIDQGTALLRVKANVIFEWPVVRMSIRSLKELASSGRLRAGTFQFSNFV